jgi:acyl-coenzyme A thioesterase PaaI-like protein
VNESVVRRLRAVAALLATRDASDALRSDVVARLDEVVSALEREPLRPRWYEIDATDRNASRLYHEDFGPLRGAANVVAPPLRFGETVQSEGRTIVVARVRFSLLHEGPPRSVHGGVVAACFDEVLAVAQRDSVNGFTTELTVRYPRPVPTETDLEFTGWIESDDGRRAVGRGECRAGGELRATAEAQFVRPRRSRDRVAT